MLLRLKVKPASKTDGINREADGILRIRIKAQPVEGKANKYLLEYLSEALGISKSKITVLKGATNQFKALEIEEDEKAVPAKLEALIG